MRKIAEIIHELDAATDYIDELESYNQSLDDMLKNCTTTVNSYKKSEHLQKELSKKEKHKCQSIKVQRDIFGVSAATLTVILAVVLIL